ncbi:TPA: hypothetical protein LSH92_004509 [Citrobacter koseri]|nr:hypothetical protein [Citrobacter koseri]
MNYTNEWYLDHNQYISDIADQMDFSTGITLLIADVGTGKTVNFSMQPNVYFIAPLVSIVESTEGVDVSTWNRKVTQVLTNPDKSIYADKILVVDECHGLYIDYSYKGSLINDLVRIFPYFRSVVLMSGTVKQEYLSCVEIDRVYRVHKAQEARKELHQYICTSNAEEVLKSLIQANINKRKAIALVNDVALCREIANSVRGSLVTVSKTKHNADVLEFYHSKRMTDASHDYRLIIGTDSIREGLSIEDELEEVDVYIFGHRHPDAIEQFCNRFRNVKGVKKVHYIVPVTDSRTMSDFDIVSHTADAERLQMALNGVYEAFETDHFREVFRTQYNNDVKASDVYYDRLKRTFAVNKVSIDYVHSEHRRRQCKHDPMMFEMTLSEYDFYIMPPKQVDGNADRAEKQENSIRVIKTIEKEVRLQVLRDLKEDFSTGNFRHVDHEEYDGLRGSIQKLIKVGLSQEQIPLVVDGYIKNQEFIKRVWDDYNYIDDPDNLRNFVIREFATTTANDYLDRIEVQVVATMTARKVLRELFSNDVELMLKNRLWGRDLRKETVFDRDTNSFKPSVTVKDAKAAARIINRYITVENRQIRKGNKRERVYFIKYYNLTGIEIDRDNVHIQPIRAASELQTRLEQLRKAG